MKRQLQAAEKIYNVKILRNYVAYLREQLNWSQQQLEELFRALHSDISILDTDDNWFDQTFTNAFHATITRMSGDPDISFKVGRYTTNESTKGIAGRMIRGLLSVEVAYSRIQKIAESYTRGSRYDVVKISKTHAVIRSTPINGCLESPHQCRNRIGMITTIPGMFGSVLRKVEHEQCFHKGGDYCEYEIHWSNVRAHGTLIYSVLIGLAFSMLLRLLSERWDAAGFGGLFAFLSAYQVLYSRDQNRFKDVLREQNEALEESISIMNRRARESQLIREVMRHTTQIMPLTELCDFAVNQIRSKMQYDRVGLLLVDDNLQVLRTAASAGFSPEASKLMQSTEFRIRADNTSGFLIRVVNSKQPLLVRDAKAQETELSERSRQFARQLGIQAFIAVPLLFEEKVLGVLTVDFDRPDRQLSTNDLELCKGLADHLAVSIQNSIIFEEQKKMLQLVRAMEAKERQRKEVFQMYVPTEISDEEQFNNSDRRKVRKELLSVMAIDIAGFTTLSERSTPEAVAMILTIYIDVINEVVLRWNGKINKVIGDGMLVYFDASNENAVRAGIEILNARHVINRRLKKKGYSPISMRIGAHRGECTIGSIGSKNRRDYTLIGDVVNTAFRIESFGKKFGENVFCFSTELLRQAEGFKYRDRGTVPLRGRRTPTRLFQIVRSENGEFDGEGLTDDLAA